MHSFFERSVLSAFYALRGVEDRRKLPSADQWHDYTRVRQTDAADDERAVMPARARSE